MRNSILLGLLLCICTLAKAQRKCDIKAELLMPDSGYTFASIAYDSIPFKLTNLGPDEVYANDAYAVGLYMQGLHYVIGSDRFKVDLAVGDSILLFQTIKVLYKESVQDIDFCINRCYAFTPITKEDTLVREREGDSTYANNLDCIKADVIYTLGIPQTKNEVEQNLLYPNPAQDIVKIKKNLINAAYQIIAISGQTIQTGFIEESNTFSVLALESGAYFVTFRTQDGTEISTTFIKQ
jgi:hypothetical protein